jgi:serralysin
MAVIVGTSGRDLLDGIAEGDTINGLAGSDSVFGGEGDDGIFGNQGGDFLVGGSGNDYLRGGQGADFLNGEDGNDVLCGDFPKIESTINVTSDVLRGGTGSDLFILRADAGNLDSPPSFIVDFNKNEDVIGLTGGLQELYLFLFERDTIPLNEFTYNAQLGDATGFSLALRELDPDGNGFYRGTFIVTPENRILGFVANASPGDLQGRFIDASSLI